MNDKKADEAIQELFINTIPQLEGSINKLVSKLDFKIEQPHKGTIEDQIEKVDADGDYWTLTTLGGIKYSLISITNQIDNVVKGIEGQA